ncbi:ABC transporter ATP-binding protein [Nocardioides insulae]|uniref:ABC transporter ATP-binding protein n=1 Tax=Nocardioides insulae TaxID=394734 RepID=UPI0004035608|nr:ABC transporter ATP-binding protein [Nocardioides insulae]
MTSPDTQPEPGAESVGTISGAELTLDKVTKRYSGQKAAAVDELSLTIPAGEIVMFVGPSGCGKTTSLKMINRLVEPTSGTISIDGQDIRRQNVNSLRRQIGYVIQGGSLFPHQSVAQNIATVPKLLGWDKARISARVEELLDLVGLDPRRYADRYPRELSGGQQQRVGVARGLAADPPVILMDEPFGAVDPITRQRLQDELLSIQRELRKTIVCVTHDIDEAIKLGDRILILQEGAQIAQYDTPENILAAPANEFVEDFVGAGSTLKQLSLTRVRDVDLSQGVTARAGDPADPVLAEARAQRATGVVVLDRRNRPIDWIRLRQLKPGSTVPSRVDEDLTTLDEDATLNDALDTMLTSSFGSAVVTGERDRYLGLIDFDTVVSHMRAVEESAQEAVDAAESGSAGPGEAEA